MLWPRESRVAAILVCLCAPVVTALGCGDEVTPPRPPSADFAISPQGAGPRALERFPQLPDVIEEVRVEPARHTIPAPLDDSALVDSVRRVDGIVLIGFRPSGSKATRETGVFHGMPRSVALAARHAIEARGATVLRTMRTSSMVVARIPADIAPALRQLPFVNYLEPDGSFSLAEGRIALQDVGSHHLSPPASHELSPPGCRGRVTRFKLLWSFSAVQLSSPV